MEPKTQSTRSLLPGLCVSILFVAVAALPAAAIGADFSVEGTWTVALETARGPLEFELDIEDQEGEPVDDSRFQIDSDV